MFDIIKAIILGIVEGVTEFLPVSSTGHLILVNQFIRFDEKFTMLFDIVIQLGAILAVLIYFWQKLWPFGKDKEKNKLTRSIWYKTIIAVLPAVIIGGLFGDIIEAKLFNPLVVAGALLIGGLILLLVENKKRFSKISELQNLTYSTAFFIGLIQCLAMIPGTSRSAATIVGGLLLGASRVVAVEFSFFLAIPTMIGASLYSLLKYSTPLSSAEIIVLTVGFLVSLLTAFIVIRFLMNYIKRHDFKTFAYWRIILALAIFALFLLKLIN